jgi:dihydroneopterin aldolase/2-amino-4-hydroxy-6-hydroxymethyldihydropteridine diphosphokinase
MGVSGIFDIITLRGLSARGHHGVYPFEREGTQPFTVDLSLWVDTRRAAAADDLDLTVDYGEIAGEAVAVLEGPSVYLLETLAQRIAEAALAHPRVHGVEVTLHKPMAPLRQQFSDVAITIRRGAAAESASSAGAPSGSATRDEASAMAVAEPGGRRSQPARDTAGWKRVVLALGANLGDPPTTLARAVGDLVDVDGLEVDEVSPLVRTLPVLGPGQAAQPDYWNAVVLARTGLDPRELLAATSAIEDRSGRIRHERWGARTLDIDIIQIQGVASDDPALTLPHPRARSRAFVLVPWELADPDAVLEGAGRVELLARTAPDRDGIRDAVSDWLEEPESVAAESDRVLAGHASQPVLPTPAGGSVVVAVPGPRVSGHSRIDRLPETSQKDLRPDGSGADYLWRKLWAQWGADTASSASPQAASGPQRPAPPPAAVTAPRAARAEGRRPAPEAGAAPEPSAPAPAPAPAAAVSQENHRSGARPASPGRRRAPKWVPVRAGARTASPAAAAPSSGDAPESAGGAARAPEGPPSLPAWNFPPREDVRIVDDARDLGSAAPVGEASAGSGPAPAGEAAPRRRSILDPKLPPSAATGTLPRDTPGPTTSIMRRVTVRPTVTGQQPIVRRDGGRGR